ncbi:MAG: shikimate dehydrogenase [Mogibacterium sp.]|nr:shikimate dehydrogenase [Mogibacterium sp.]
MKYGLIGEKLGHSFSPEIHKKLGRYGYELKELAADMLPGFLEQKEFDGINVTIPYKQAVIPYLDEISDTARAIGAVNTIVNRNGKLTGYNTDAGGLKKLIGRAGADPCGKTVLIAGSGGTSLTAERVALDMGASQAVRMSRSSRNGAITYEEAYEKYAGAGIIINTTPAGMYPDTEGMPVDPGRFSCLEGVIDVIYNPLMTKLVSCAQKKGIRAENGLYMLVAQAMQAAELFTGTPVDDAETDRIYREVLAEKSNIVLVGMPGSGKSTVGSILAEKLGRDLTDTDELIQNEASMEITEIFSRFGEGHFRDLESDVIYRSSLTGGAVISTGGGAVLRAANVENLHRNGTIVFLDRSPDELIPTEDRPLADSMDKIRALYEARHALYEEAADICIRVCGTPQETAEEIWRAMH